MPSLAVKFSLAFGCSAAILFYVTSSKHVTFRKLTKNILVPLLNKLPEETAHDLAITFLKYRLMPVAIIHPSPELNINVLNRNFSHPIGLAAGFDKNAFAFHGLEALGFSFIEIGSVTPKPQPGNEKPRLFRLTEDEAIINRYGFNSDGCEKVYERLSKIANIPDRKCLLGVSLSKNKDSTNMITDVLVGIEKFAKIADYIVVNVSSPNTPGLRNFQARNQLSALLTAIRAEVERIRPQLPILLKLSPDLTFPELEDIAEIIRENKSKVDGLILTNTTTRRDFPLKSINKQETGGLSGQPIKDLSTSSIKFMYKLLGGSIPIIGVGGVKTGKDVYDKMCAGASLVQIYTSFIYEGPYIVESIHEELVTILRSNGYNSIDEIIGTEVM